MNIRTPILKFGSCAARNRPDHKSSIFKYFAGKVRMDRARQDKGS
jgi:hypothetical protein